MTIASILSRQVDTVGSLETARTAAQRMLQRNVGSLVVLDRSRRPVGIVTDRDLTLRVLALGRDGSLVPVGEVMTPDPRTVRDGASIVACLDIMRTVGARRLPVVDAQDAIVGVVSIDDILGRLAEEARLIGTVLAQESPGALHVT